MNNYEPPVILVNEEAAEGVYTASGAGMTQKMDVTKVELSREGNQYYKVNTYNVTIANPGSEEAGNWSASVSVTSGTASGVTIYNNWLASASLNGNIITITPGGGGAIGAGGSIEVEIVVNYDSDSVEVK